MNHIALRSPAELRALIARAGIVPLFRSGVPGYSVEDLCPDAPWYSGEESDPWQMRIALAGQKDIVYGKLMGGKAAFADPEAYARLLNCRRDGYDFDTRLEQGVISARERAVMRVISDSAEPLFAFQLKRQAGFGRDGLSGFEQTTALLQQKCYLVVAGFGRKRDRFGKEYGWSVNLYTTPEQRFGQAFIDLAYLREPQDDLNALCARALSAFPNADPEALRRLLAG